MGKSAHHLQFCKHRFDNNALPQPSWLETELEQRKRLVILVPNKLSSALSQRKIVPSREARVQLAIKKEMTVVERMASGYKEYVKKLWKLVGRVVPDNPRFYIRPPSQMAFQDGRLAAEVGQYCLKASSFYNTDYSEAMT